MTTLGSYADEYLALRTASGLILDRAEVVDAVIRAARQYAAYGVITSAEGGVATSVVETTEITLGEWALIRPLFELHVERENALLLGSASAGGLAAFGRSVAEIEGDINNYLATLPDAAFDEGIVTIE